MFTGACHVFPAVKQLLNVAHQRHFASAMTEVGKLKHAEIREENPHLGYFYKFDVGLKCVCVYIYLCMNDTHRCVIMCIIVSISI